MKCASSLAASSGDRVGVLQIDNDRYRVFYGPPIKANSMRQIVCFTRDGPGIIAEPDTPASGLCRNENGITSVPDLVRPV
jgi:hypothetical protein